jgi:CO/xanthine dehydrogenase FAD-binding subunit
MKSAPFEYARPQSVDEVCRMLAAADGEAQILAGGQSLMPLLASRLARPGLLLDINRIAELQGIAVDAEALTIGGCTRQRAVERSAEVAAACPLLIKALRHVGHIQTRNRGTIGGSLCQADPAGEIPLVAVTLDARVTLHSAEETRNIAAGEFITGAMETAAAADECLVSVAFPLWREARLGTAFHEVAMRHGDFALLSAAAQLALDGDGRCTRAALGLGNAGPRPIRMDRAAAALEGTMLSDEDITAALAPLQDEIAPLDDAQATATYRRRVAPRLLRRAIRDAAAEAGASAA